MKAETCIYRLVTNRLSGLQEEVPAWFKRPIKTLINHFDFVFGNLALKPLKNASCAMESSL